MPGLSISTAHLSKGLQRLIEQYKGKRDFEALLTAFLTQVQELENAIFEVYEGRLFENAVGVQLDLLGKLVGEQRLERADTPYHVWIGARIRINRSDGKERDFRALLDPNSNGIFDAMLDYQDLPPAFFVCTVKQESELAADNDPPLTGADIFKMLNEARAGGVGFDMIQFTTDADHAFTFKDIGGYDYPFHGWEDGVADPAIEVGGKLHHVKRG